MRIRKITSIGTSSHVPLHHNGNLSEVTIKPVIVKRNNTAKNSLGARLRTWFGHLQHPIDALIVSKGFFRPRAKLPESPLSEPPDKADINHEVLQMPTSDGKLLHGYFFPASEKTDNTIVFLHGRTGNVDNYYPVCLTLQNNLQKQGKPVNALIFDYRGFGKSSGRRPTRQTVLVDAYSAYRYLKDKKDIPSNKITIVGHSSGAAVALGLASILAKRKEELNLVVVASTYLSPKAAAKATIRGISSWKLFLISNKLLNPERLIRDIEKIPIVIIHGENDSYFPIEHSQTLYKLASGNNKYLMLIPGGGHANVFDCLKEEHFKYLAEFFG